MFKWIIRLLNRASVSQKLLLIYFLLITVPLGCFSYLAYFRINATARQQTLSTAKIRFDESFSIIEKQFNSAQEVAKMISLDECLFTALARDISGYALDEQKADHDKLVDIFKYLKRGTEISSINIYVDPKLKYANDTVYFFPQDSIIHDLWFQHLSASGKSRLWCPPSLIPCPKGGSPVIAYAGTIYNRQMNVYDVLAFLRIDIPAAIIQTELSEAIITENGQVFLTDGQDILLAGNPQNTAIPADLPASMYEGLSPGTWKFIENGSDDPAVLFGQFSNGWHLVAVIPQKDITSLGTVLRNEMLVIMLVITVLAYIVAIITSKSSVRRITELTRSMKKVEEGNFDICIKKTVNDEIGDLTEGFNLMTSKISTLIDEKFNMGQEIKSVELKALQAQINPHFLYNTLELINCTAIEHYVPEIAEIVNALSKFYKLGLSHGMDLILIKDEITHVSLYVKIQNMRFGDKIRFTLDVDENILNEYTLKIILQPIVENAIIHGIFEKDSHAGQVRITGKLDGETIRFIIEDDGVGMSIEKSQYILSDIYESDSKGGYGLKNIDRRIKLYYGHPFGLTIDSDLGRGTRVLVTFPARFRGK